MRAEFGGQPVADEQRIGVEPIRRETEFAEVVLPQANETFAIVAHKRRGKEASVGRHLCRRCPCLLRDSIRCRRTKFPGTAVRANQDKPSSLSGFSGGAPNRFLAIGWFRS